MQLLRLKMQILINMDILVMELDLIEDNVFHFQMVNLVKIFGADMSSSAHINNKEKDILVMLLKKNTYKKIQ